MYSVADLVPLFMRLRNTEENRFGRMRELARIYDGHLLTPLPELDEVAESSVPGIISQGVDGYGRMFAEVQPTVTCPPVRPSSAASRRRAEDRTKVLRAWWANSELRIADYQRGRFFFGYGAMPVIVRSCGLQPGVPEWEVLNPMCVIPGPRRNDYTPEIEYGFVARYRSIKWCQDAYGIRYQGYARPDALVEVVEYVDCEQITVFILGTSAAGRPAYGDDTYPRTLGATGEWTFAASKPFQVRGGGWATPVSTSPNFAGRCTISYPGAISLSRVGGIVDNILGMHKLQARLMALWTRGIAKGIWPDVWFLSGENGTGRIISMADGMRGKIGQIDGGGQIVMNQINPGYQVPQAIDRLEANQRSTAGIVPQLGGYNPTNVRTGKASDTVAGFALDPILAEAHTISETAREHEDKLAIAVARGYGGGRKRSFYVVRPDSNTEQERVDYDADSLFGESDENRVRYGVAGADMNTLIIAVAQSQGTEQMSKRRARELNPLVENPDGEERQIMLETVTGAMLPRLIEMAQSPDDMALVAELVEQGVPVPEIARRVQKAAQERQASAGPLGAPDGPAAPGSPETQPGLAPPGAGAEVPPAVEAPPESASNLAQLLTTTRRPSMTVPAERTA